MQLDLIVVQRGFDWRWQRRTDGELIATSKAYGSKRAAKAGLIDDFVASVKHVASMAYVVMTVEEEREMRKTLGKQIQIWPECPPKEDQSMRT